METSGSTNDKRVLMSPEQLSHLVRQTLLITLEIGAPFLLTALIVGSIISFIQSAIQMHEMTLSFVPKMGAILLLFIFLFPWMLKILSKFIYNILIYQWETVTALYY